MDFQKNKEDILSNGEKLPVYIINGHKEPVAPPVSKLREALPQIFAVSAKNLLLLTFGTSLGFSTILLPELQKSNPEIPVTSEEITWISSINLFMVPIGCLVSGPLSQYFGRRKTMMIATVPFVIAWMIFHYAVNTAMLFIALTLTGLTGGLLEAPVLTYVAEVTQPHLRGMLSATSTMAVIFGVFTQMLTGSLVGWRTVALVNLTYPILCLFCLSLVPESPTWLANKGRLPEAESALCWLRGWVTPASIKKEFSVLCQEYEKPVKVSTINAIILNSKNQSQIVETPKPPAWKNYLHRTFYLPFSLVSLIFFVNAFGGVFTVQTFAVFIFNELHAPINSYTATVFMGIAQVIGTLLCVILIHYSGKRKLSFVSIIGNGAALFFISCYGIAIRYGYNINEGYSWVPTTLVITSMFFSHFALKTLPWILAGEVFPTNVRSFATGTVGSMSYIFTSISNKTFLYMVNGFTLPGTFLIYAMTNFIGCAILYFTLPETEGRTLKEIEEHFAGTNNLKNRPKKDKLAVKEKWAVENFAAIKDDESRL